MPGDGLLVLCAFAVDGFRLDAQTGVHAHFQIAEPRHDAAILQDGRVVVDADGLCFVGADVVETLLVGEVFGLAVAGFWVEVHLEDGVCTTAREGLATMLGRKLDRVVFAGIGVFMEKSFNQWKAKG